MIWQKLQNLSHNTKIKQNSTKQNNCTYIHNISINLFLSKLLISIHRLMKRKRRRNLLKQMNLKIKQRALAPPILMPPIMQTKMPATMQRNRMIQALQPPHKSKIASNTISIQKKLHFYLTRFVFELFWPMVGLCVRVLCTCTCGGWAILLVDISHIANKKKQLNHTQTHTFKFKSVDNSQATIHKTIFIILI